MNTIAHIGLRKVAGFFDRPDSSNVEEPDKYGAPQFQDMWRRYRKTYPDRDLREDLSGMYSGDMASRRKVEDAAQQKTNTFGRLKTPGGYMQDELIGFRDMAMGDANLRKRWMDMARNELAKGGEPSWYRPFQFLRGMAIGKTWEDAPPRGVAIRTI